MRYTLRFYSILKFLSCRHETAFLALSAAATIMLVAGCAEKETSDAYGQFEAETVTVSARAGGELLEFSVREGERLESGERVGLVDTAQAALHLEEAEARIETVRSRLDQVEAETDVVRERLATARGDLRRMKALAADSAVAQRELDDVRGRVRALEKEISAMQTRKAAVRAEMGPLRVRVRQLEDRLEKARIVNPVNGRVLNRLADRHELVGEGQPLYEIADLDTLQLRVYVSGAQLPEIMLGQNVEVLVDKDAGELRAMSGVVSWIASESEFTPQMIQTREERVSQVYAVKVRVANPGGRLKIGMPGEVNFDTDKGEK